MSDYNYLENITREPESIDDDIAKEFDILNDEIIKFTEGRGEIVYSVMENEEKRTWFGDAAMEECFFIDFISHLKNENLENIELKNRLACVSYNTTYPVLFNTPLAEINAPSVITCRDVAELRECISKIVNTNSFKHSLFRAKKGGFTQQQNDVYRIQFFKYEQYTILFAAEKQATTQQWFGYVSVGTLNTEAYVSTEQANDIESLKIRLINKYREDYSLQLSFDIPILPFSKIPPRLLFKLYNKSCENTEIARKCRIVQTKLDQIVPGGPTTII